MALTLLLFYHRFLKELDGNKGQVNLEEMQKIEGVGLAKAALIAAAIEFASRVVSVGLVNRTHVHPREVFADPITDRASAIIIDHNHPSGGLTPSMEYLEITKQLKSAGETLGIRLLDHIIFNHKGHYSFLESGEL